MFPQQPPLASWLASQQRKAKQRELAGLCRRLLLAQKLKLRRRTPLQQQCQASAASTARQGKASTTTVDRCTSFLVEKENNLPCAACPATPELPCLLACKKRRKLCTACLPTASSPQPNSTQLNSAQQNENSAAPSTTSGKRRKSPSTRRCRARADQQQRTANLFHPQRPLKSFFLFSHGFLRQKTLGKKKIWRTCNVWDRKITPCMFQMGAKKT